VPDHGAGRSSLMLEVLIVPVAVGRGERGPVVVNQPVVPGGCRERHTTCAGQPVIVVPVLFVKRARHFRKNPPDHGSVERAFETGQSLEVD